MISVITSLMAGCVAWSLSHYAVHRWWHNLIVQSDPHAEPNAFVAGEFFHHDIYDDDPYDPSRDPRKRFISFPWPLTAVASVVAALVYTAGLWGAEQQGWVAGGVAFLAGCIGSMTLDDWVHRHIQHGGARGGTLSRWLWGYHRVHHDRHQCNYAFLTGIGWDLLLGSYRGSAQDKEVTTKNTLRHGSPYRSDRV